MKTIRQKSLITLIVLFVLSLCLSLTVAPVSAKAEDTPIIEMESGAQLYLGGDAIRFVAKMNEAAYNEIVTDDAEDKVSLKILVAPRQLFDKVEDGNYVNLSAKVEFEIPDSKIYRVGDYFYANARLENLNSDALTEKQMGYDFVAIAVKVEKSVVDEQEVESFTYAEFAGGDIANNTRSQYQMVNDAVLTSNSDAAAIIMAPESPYSWYATEEYPIVTNTEEQVEALEELVNAGTIVLEDVEAVLNCKFKTESNANLFDFTHEIDAQTHTCPCGEKFDIAALRTGEDANTVFFFDRAEGRQQLAMQGGTNLSADADIVFDEAKGATKFVINTTASSSSWASIPYDTKGYEFNDGDYLAFDVYVNITEISGGDVSATSSIDICATTTTPRYGTRILHGQYAQILIPASQIVEGGKFWIEGATRKAEIYFFKAKAIPASEVKDIATTGSETTYSLSCYDFVGGSYATVNDQLGTTNFEATYNTVGGLNVGACAWSTNGSIYSQVGDVVPYYVDGAIRFYVRNHQKNGMAATQRLVLKLATPATFTSGAITVVARGAAFAGNVYLRNSTNNSFSGQKGMAASADQTGLPEGYVRYTMTTDFNSSWGSESYDYIIFDVTPVATGADYAQGTISSIWFPNIVKSHVYGEGKLISEATCTEAAEYEYTCTVCGTVTTKSEGEALGHTFTVEEVKDQAIVSTATCQAPAKYFKSCEDCGAVSTDDNDTFVVGDVVDHNYVDGKCEWCDKSSGFDFAAARTGEDANTVFFFDREEGRQQLAMQGGTNLSADADIVFDEAKGATKFVINTTASSSSWASIPYDTKGYEFNDGDYLAFDVYVNITEISGGDVSATSSIDICATTTTPRYGTRILHGQYAQILIPASQIVEGGKFWIEGATRKAEIYFFKAKAIPASEVKDIATTGSETTYTLSGYSFVGGNYATDNPASLGTTNYEAKYTTVGSLNVGACAWSTNGAIYSQASDVLPYYVDGAIRFYLRNHQKNGMAATQRLVLKLATPATFTSGAITVVARGAAFAGNVYLRNSTNTSFSGQKGMAASADQTGLPEGYVRYTMTTNFSSSWGSESYDYIIFDVTPVATGADYAQGTISNIWFPNIAKN